MEENSGLQVTAFSFENKPWENMQYANIAGACVRQPTTRHFWSMFLLYISDSTVKLTMF